MGVGVLLIWILSIYIGCICLVGSRREPLRGKFLSVYLYLSVL